ncbi:MAG TPA: hypothetical protein VMZ91_00285 [Candidatus Paceibacterota bacterium]|nr:hypothetical protein [Candidatus Paceibacterota bacterium]
MAKKQNNKSKHSHPPELEEKEMIYLSFIYLLEPFYIDKRGDKIRKKVRKLLIITEKEEVLILGKLERLNLVEKTGFFISPRNKKRIKDILDNLIQGEKIDLEKITKLFIS